MKPKKGIMMASAVSSHPIITNKRQLYFLWTLAGTYKHYNKMRQRTE